MPISSSVVTNNEKGERGQQALQLPSTHIQRICKNVLSKKEVRISKAAAVALGRSASLFAFYLTSAANDVARNSNKPRLTVSAADVLQALSDVQFEEIANKVRDLQQNIGGREPLQEVEMIPEMAESNSKEDLPEDENLSDIDMDSKRSDVPSEIEFENGGNELDGKYQASLEALLTTMDDFCGNS